jgi:hypothetical protein
MFQLRRFMRMILVGTCRAVHAKSFGALYDPACRRRARAFAGYDDDRHGYDYTRQVEQFPRVAVSEAELFALLVAQKAVAHSRGTPFQKPLQTAFEKGSRMPGRTFPIRGLRRIGAVAERSNSRGCARDRAGSRTRDVVPLGPWGASKGGGAGDVQPGTTSRTPQTLPPLDTHVQPAYRKKPCTCVESSSGHACLSLP